MQYTQVSEYIFNVNTHARIRIVHCTLGYGDNIGGVGKTTLKEKENEDGK
jgi:hypothetical protein